MTIPIFLAMGVLIILIQIFSISIAGLVFFCCMMVLFVQRKLDFSKFFSWILVMLVQITCIVYITANFLACTSYVSQFQTGNYFRFIGIDAINNFLLYATSRGYIICLILLFILSSFIQRIFMYHAIWNIAVKVLNLGEIR